MHGASVSAHRLPDNRPACYATMTTPKPPPPAAARVITGRVPLPAERLRPPQPPAAPPDLAAGQADRLAQAKGLFRQHQWREALPLWAELQRQRPDDPEMAHGHAVTLTRMGRHAEALAGLRTVLARWPDFLPARLNLAGLLRRDFRRPDEALSVLDPALSAHDRVAVVHFHRGRVLQDLVRHAEAMDAYDRCLALDPSYIKAISAYAFCAHYQPDPDLAALRRWLESRTAALPALVPPTQTHARPGPRLRVGLLSGDLCDHPVAYFLESVLEALHHRGVDLIAYATGERDDAVSQRLRRHTHAWHRVAALKESALAQRIADDRLDVLLDLAGFTNHHRLGTLRRHPAPVQVGWLGYFGTLGMPALDAVIADRHCVPPDEQRFFSERLLYLPDTRLCFTAPADAPEPAPEPPMARGGGIRLACLQNLHKINRRVLAAWRRILDGAPEATLLLQARQLAHPEVRRRFETLLDASGIDRRRVDLVPPRPRPDYLAGYAEVDVLLDTFPYPGGTTTCEALWMGVPTLTLATPGMLGRQGQALLQQVDLQDWVTHSDDDYVQRAITLARDREGTLTTLRHLRRQLRETARRSPLFDADTFAQHLEALLRQACNAHPQHPPAGAS